MRSMLFSLVAGEPAGRSEGEVWHTGCDWWDMPRDFGFTDEHIDYPTRMGILFGAKESFLLHMFYSKKAEDYYREIVGLLPFKGREFHHAYNDDVWGKGFKGNDLPFLENIRLALCLRIRGTCPSGRALNLVTFRPVVFYREVHAR